MRRSADTPEISNLQAEIARLEDELHSARARLTAALTAASPVKVGDMVRYTGRRSGMASEFLVRRINLDYGWVTASPRKANGDWSRVARNLFDKWELVAAPQVLPAGVCCPGWWLLSANSESAGVTAAATTSAPPGD